ncbi:serine/threonine protein kinase [Streptosporangium becharense]|uniref:non-specific serine/threonine protein kinase n=1 Tax=Streptosporangium becharense TaxID=1816182 RepID=A0A7W9MIS8_9ACTN|nr:serine/threonine-protein kinase [Streptosporangium becharense]MBB2910991.1 serine/threonine protein kinase [Streptosporangium becharense]MBB5821951.1 serine/threonine protein kinase [Streptosporangium becharense]
MNNLTPGDPLQIGRYRVLSQLGRGGMGTVYLGESDGGQQVAIKVINPEYSRHEQFRMRFRREADAAQRVRRFCTAAVLDAALDGDQLYVVTEYVPGPSLEEAVRTGGPLRGSSLDALAVGVATALAAIHGAGVVHRDLKPSNVLLSPVGPRVIDFGIARALDSLSGITGTGEIIGTPRYMAPEVLRGEPVSPSCDVFSWGCLVAFAASGQPPFNGEALHAVVYQVLNTEPSLEGMEPALRELVTYALVKDPRYRPTSQQLLDHLVGRSAAPEQAVHSVQTAWQQTSHQPAGHQPPGGPTPGTPMAPGSGTSSQPAAWQHTGQPATQQTGWQHTGSPHTGAPHTVVASPNTVADRTTASPHRMDTDPTTASPHRMDTDPTTASSHRMDADRPGTPRAGADHTVPGGALGRARWMGVARRNPLLAVAAAALIVVGGGFGAHLLLSPGGPPESLPLIYQDDFTQSGTGWAGSTYDPAGTGNKYGYASGGYYAIDVDGDTPVRQEDAPIPFVPAAPPTPTPGATPTPITPARLLVGADLTVHRGSTGQGEYGLFCRGDDDTKATRYEFLIDTDGNARIRKSVKSAGGELAKPVPVELGDGPNSIQAECTPADDGLRLTMWVNGEQAQSILDANPLPNGQVGVIARVGENSKSVLKVGFDNFTLHGQPSPNPS